MHADASEFGPVLGLFLGLVFCSIQHEAKKKKNRLQLEKQHLVMVNQGAGLRAELNEGISPVGSMSHCPFSVSEGGVVPPVSSSDTGVMLKSVSLWQRPDRWEKVAMSFLLYWSLLILKSVVIAGLILITMVILWLDRSQNAGGAFLNSQRKVPLST